MREIESFKELELAAGFHNVLKSHGIEAEIMRDEESSSVWILDEDKMREAIRLLEEFRLRPERSFSPLPPAKKEPTFRQRLTAPRRRARVINYRTQASDYQNKTTLTMIAICVVIYLAMQSGAFPGLTEYLYFSRYSYPLFAEIRQGQIWRLITPIFLHFGIFHIVFNMLWLHQLGSQIEVHNGSRYLVSVVFILGVISNIGEFLMSQSLFGGMSGVVYGLLGFIWMMSRYKPRSGYYIDRGTVGFMLVWFFLTMTPLFPNIAHTTHLVGLAGGLVWGYIASGRFREISGR